VGCLAWGCQLLTGDPRLLGTVRSPVFGDSNVLSALNFSTKVDLFSDISASGRDVEEIRHLHPPHSEGDELQPRSTGHLVLDLHVSNRPPMGAI